jgi:hypothetical protein
MEGMSEPNAIAALNKRLDGKGTAREGYTYHEGNQM